MIEDRPVLNEDEWVGEYPYAVKEKRTYPSMSYLIWTLRPSYRLPPLWMWLNMFRGRCWCGKEKKDFDKYQRKYCSSKHSAWYYYHMTPNWNHTSYQVLERDRHTCVLCGFSKRGKMEVDHIVALCNGGDMWNKDNLRTLCHECHRDKTREERHEQKRKRLKQEVLI